MNVELIEQPMAPEMARLVAGYAALADRG